ncbi:MAG: CDP-glycerol glycerophosphotransferase family protein [Blautia sp.]|nr:CDP-glycerol glycerophosphotransferase family protein [Blautia sp.]
MKDCTVKKIRLRRNAVQIVLQIRNASDGLQFFLKEATDEGVRVPLSGVRRGKTITLSFSPDQIPLSQGDWEVTAAESGSDAEEYLPLTAGIRRTLLMRGGSVSAGSGKLVAFPMAGDGERLMVRVRPATVYDTAAVWWKERTAWALGLLLRRMGIGREARVVFEKFCGQAQDNGFAYFTWCMKNLPESEKRHIYYVLDRRASGWQTLKKEYGRQLTAFMSLRHMLLMMLSPLYIASESRTHGYLWQTRPNPLFRDIRNPRHRILFLQHGVTGLKRVDKVFGKKGYDPMTWFAVTSPKEQEIVMRNFGYSAEQAPVLGFARWDMLEDRRDPERPYILLMPTWRSWLERADELSFRESEYYRVYNALLSNREFLQMLREKGTELLFYIHPKLASMLGSFHQEKDTPVHLIPYGSRRLDELIMGCSALVTDYSSVCWDACYLSKPVIFFQFDADRYLRVTGSYLDFETELPGPRAADGAALTEEIRKSAERCWQPDPESAARAARMLPVRDRNNCARTEAFIKETT